MSVPRCESCKYGIDMGKFGYRDCRRHAPLIFEPTCKCGCQEHRTLWPVVNWHDLCGDWEERPDVPEEKA